MDSRGPTTTVRAGAPTAVVGTSRLAQMQTRMYLAGKRTLVTRHNTSSWAWSSSSLEHKHHQVTAAANMKLKSLDYGDIIESFTNRYENIVKKMRFQQRQQQERDQRKIEQIATRTTTTTGTVAIASSNGGRTATTATTTSGSAVSATVELTERLNATSLSSTLGAGKVRQMFDERRHRVAGIDKSYPLQPIQTTSTVPVAHGNHAVNGNTSNNGNDGGASLARGMAKTGLNNKPRVPPISASSRTRLMQQQAQARGPTNLRQDSLVGMQPNRTNNGGDALDPNGAGYDDNDNFLELEKFPDTVPFDEDALDSADRVNVLNGNGVVTKTGKAHAVTATKPITPSNTIQKSSKKSPATSSSSVPAARSPNGSAKSGVATPRSTVPSGRSNGPSRTVTQPTSPSSSAGSVRRPSTVSSSMQHANEPVPDGLTRCDICSRNFATDRIDKHRQICQKTKSKKRKVFDITKHRVQGTDAESFVLKGKKSSTGPAGSVASRKQSSQLSSVSSVGAAAAAAAGGKQSNWRKKHEEFIATIRAAKEMKAHLARGGKLSDLPPPPPSENPDYIQCPHCSRRFNQTAAERHIPKCATMLHNKPKPKPKAASTIRRY